MQNPRCIEDLPDDCVLNILSRIGSATIPVGNFVGYVRVDHPLQSALVCRRWRNLADYAVCSLRIRSLNMTLLKVIRRRFRHLTALKFTHLNGDYLLALANCTPELAELALPIEEAIYKSFERAALTWTNLKKLDLVGNMEDQSTEDVLDVLDVVRQLSSLQCLRFSCRLPAEVSIWKGLDSMTGLTSLMLHCCQIPPAFTQNLSRVLRELVLDDLYETRSGRCFKSTSLPEDLGRLTNLEILEVRNCRNLRTWPESLGNLSALQSLEISGCLTTPTSLAQLTSLNTVRIPMRSVSELLEGLGELPSLRELGLFNAGRNPGKLLLPAGHFSKLQVLEIVNCGSLNISLTRLETLTSLKVLRVRHSNLQFDGPPKSFSNLTELETCDIRHVTGLRLLPDGIGSWQKLTQLVLSGCSKLESLPETLGMLRSLRELKIKYCSSLAHLPLSLGSLTSLKYLHLVSCERLQTLPATIADLAAVERIRVEGCTALSPLSKRLRRFLAEKHCRMFRR